MKIEEEVQQISVKKVYLTAGEACEIFHKVRCCYEKLGEINRSCGYEMPVFCIEIKEGKMEIKETEFGGTALELLQHFKYDRKI